MRDTIRYLMVAAAVHVLILGAVSAQSPPSGFEVPQSVGGGFGGTTSSSSVAEHARNAANSGSPSLGLPDFTSAGIQRAGARPGGPSTEPTSTRDNSWLTDTAGQRGRPSTAPFNAGASSSTSTSTGNSANSSLPNSLRSNFGSDPNAVGFAGSVATVAATEDPLSPEAQLRARARENQLNSAAANGRSAPVGTPSNFASLPEGISLPTRNATAPPGGTFGSEFARSPSSPNGTRPPVYGPKTAEEANFDYSVFNTNRNTATQNPTGQATAASQSTGTAQQNLGLPTAYANPSAAGFSNNAATGLGMPGGSTATPPAQNTLPANWTYKEIAELGKYFGIAPNDPNMSDLAYVQKLYAAYQQHQLKKTQANQFAANAYAGNSTTAAASSRNPWDTAAGGTTTGTFGTPNASATPYQGQPGSQRDLVNSEPRFATTGMLTPPQNTSSATSGGGRRVQLYDAFGNKVDADGNVLDENGQPVDDATKFELTYGKKLNEQMALLRKEQAELERSKTQQVASSPSDRFAPDGSIGFRDGQTGLGFPSGSVAAPRRDDPNSSAGAQRPSVGDGLSSIQSPNGIPQPDQAGLGGAGKVIGKSNPYVNVFLLCSLVANAFLFISMHRLWYHHRDLIASSRMASSGISTSD